VIGKALLHYQIIEKLGEGGMGTVYKARDTHLDRFVAIKVLPAERVTDLKRKQRFMQEAKAASALNHPCIITVHDFNSDAGVEFIVMEYVRGKTLDQLIGCKGLALNDALKYAIDVADALAKAHSVGIVHRDLKPANIMVTDQGFMKVLDFGLAKLVETTPGSDVNETRTYRSVTEEGTIVGTVAYMSPEQAEGKPVDSRSDIFSFGSMLYEMLTGRRPFQGETKASTIAAILREESEPVSQIKAGLPSEVERIVKRCLRKDPMQRVQHMDDLKVALEELKRESDSGLLAQPPPTKPRVRRLVWVSGLSTLLAFTGLGIWFVRSNRKLSEPSEPVALTTYAGMEGQASFAPDGTQVAFTWCREGSSCHIYIKQIGVEPPARLTAGQGSQFSPAWSPDGQLIAFVRGDQPSIAVLPQRGGQERILVPHLDLDMSTSIGPYLSWTPDSKWIAFSDGAPAPSIYLFSTESGERRRLTNGSPAALGEGDTNPAFSPDGRSLAFTRLSDGGGRSDIYVLKLTTGYAAEREPEKLRSGNIRNFTPAWTEDGREVVFSSRSAANLGLWRITALTRSLPRRIPFAPSGASSPAITRRLSRLVYTQGKSDENIWRINLDHQAFKTPTPTRLIASTRADYAPAISPDGKIIAFASDRSGSDEIWVCDADGSNPIQLTSLGGTIISGPKWSWNGHSIAFWAAQKHPEIYVVNENGGPGALQQLSTATGGKWPYWSRDGKSIYFASGGETPEIWRMRSSGGGAVQITRNSGDNPQESPDGRFVYYSKGWPSMVSIWKVPVEGGGETKIIDSVNPSTLWAIGSKGIYFFAYDDKGQSELRVQEFATGKTKKLLKFDRPISWGLTVSPDDRTILYTQVDEAGSDLMLVENFH
jgi:serine/threonine protein kinase